MWTLTITERGGTRIQRMPDGTWTVGRGAGCTVVLQSPGVSREHARFRVARRRLFVADAGSARGTRVNGRNVTGEAEVPAGGVVQLGDVRIACAPVGHVPVAISDETSMAAGVATIVRPIVMGPSAPRPSADPGRLMTLLSEIGKTLVTAGPLDDLLGRVVTLAFGVLPAEQAVVMLRDGGGQLAPRVMRRRDGEFVERPLVSRTVIDLVLRDRVALLAADAPTDDRLHGAESIHVMQVRSIMCAPLWSRDQIIGVLVVDSPFSRQFTEADLDVFHALANYAAAAIDTAALRERLALEARQRERLQRYHSPAVAERILTGEGTGDALSAQEREVSVLFSDLCGFTTLCERLPTRRSVELLNAYFTRMTDVVFAHDGTLDKFIGDGLMAVFGAPLEQPDHAVRAVAAARDMRRALQAMNEEQPESPLAMRIGIASGVVMAGDVGSVRRREFTVLGDVVNTAARLEHQVARPGQIVIAGTTRAALGTTVPVRALGPQAVAGRVAPVDCYEVLE
jgi:adenylate cyclase